ncbi:hypothetical protein QJS10_CPB21g01762 [Acorus calamus]|uniref:Late embryogenesis abundant protein LEA-2 subgroup domain-containing protein n=1 Tax=Acorus calamus TaxID=4465 RepID=A0AAV9C6U3_ACOCL|nr:hypothetical protein QJS10_CPB21g01762 [Acorus calamus]
MTEEEGTKSHPLRRNRRRLCVSLTLLVLVLLLTLFIICLILALTLFKPKDPDARVLSTTITGVSPRVTLPVLHVELNLTLDLVVRVHNPNRASFTHSDGASHVTYRGIQVADADVAPGKVPSRGSEDMKYRLTVEADRLAEKAGSLATDVLSGGVGFDINTRLPGRVNFLGIIKRHAVAVSDCHIVVGFPRLKVKSQECNTRTKI